MPGLFGHWCPRGEQVDDSSLKEMAESMRHTDLLSTQVTMLPAFGAGSVYLDRLIPEVGPVTDSSARYYLWLDGEFINRNELVTKYKLSNQEDLTDARLALTLFQRVGWEYLNQVNGIFNIALYDQLNHSLTIASDRYGLRPLYCIRMDGGFGYAGELKALLELNGVRLRIDSRAVAEWFSFGQLLGNSTWIKGASLFPRGTIRQINEQGVTENQYWSWENIEQQDIADETEAVEELGRLWIQAVERRLDDKKLSVFLSGGLDSRSVLAAIPNNASSITAITFGEANCYDFRVAKQVASLKGVDHYFIEINSDNWLEGRLDAVWRTDGMVPLIHLHGVRGLHHYQEISDVDIQSFAGDLILGGSYLKQGYVDDWRQSYSTLFASMHMGASLVDEHDSKELLLETFSQYATLNQSDYIFLDNRVRRFTNCGTIALRSHLERRFPTYDNDLIEFVYSLKPQLRSKGNLYHKMLISRFSEYYSDIPWQKTGLPIDAPRWRRKLKELNTKLNRGSSYLSRRLNIQPLMRGRGFASYYQWMRDQPARTIINQTLLGESPQYSEYINEQEAKKIIDRFFKGNISDLTTVTLLLTFEIYLRQLYDEPMNYDNKNS